MYHAAVNPIYYTMRQLFRKCELHALVSIVAVSVQNNVEIYTVMADQLFRFKILYCSSVKNTALVNSVQ